MPATANDTEAITQSRIARQRQGILWQLDNVLELPLVILGFVWLVLLVLDFSTELGAKASIGFKRHLGHLYCGPISGFGQAVINQVSESFKFIDPLNFQQRTYQTEYSLDQFCKFVSPLSNKNPSPICKLSAGLHPLTPKSSSS